MYKFEYLSLRRLYALSYATEFNINHPSINNFYRLPTIFDTTYIFSDEDWKIFGKRFLSLFNKSEADFINDNDLIIIELHDDKLLNQMIKECKSYKIVKDKVNLILKFKIVPHSEFIAVLPEDSNSCFKIVNKQKLSK